MYGISCSIGAARRSMAQQWLIHSTTDGRAGSIECTYDPARKVVYGRVAAV